MRSITDCFARAMVVSQGATESHLLRLLWFLLLLPQALFSKLLKLGVRLPFRPLVAVRHSQRDLKKRIRIRDGGLHIPVWIELIGRLVIPLFRVLVFIRNYDALGIQGRHASFCEAELIGTEIKTLFWFRVRPDRTALLGDDVLQNVFQCVIAESNDLDFIVISSKDIGSIDIDICESLIEGKERMFSVVVRSQQPLFFSGHSYEDKRSFRSGLDLRR